MSRANLHVVPRSTTPVGPADILAQVVPELIAAEAVVARLRQIADGQRHLLAKERGVAFIRPESVRREFA